MNMEYFLLKDVCNINMGQSPDSSSYNDRGEGLPFFQGNADFGERYPITRVWSNMPIKKANANDILISVRAPIGALNYAKETCCIGRGLAALTPNLEKVSSEFIFWMLKGKNAELNSQGTGSTFKAISKKVLEEIRVPNTDLNTQKLFSSNLERVYKIIQLRKQQLQQLDELVKARFVEMFGDPVKNTMEWKSKPLNDVCEGIGDGLHGTPEYDDNGDYPFINGNNLIDGKIVVTPATKMVAAETYKKHFINISPNAILISINGTLGKMAFYNREQVMLGKSACYCNLKQGINKVFVYGVMKSDAFAEFLENSSTKSTIKNVGLKAMREFRLILPPTEMQEQFTTFVEQVDKSKFAVQKALDEAQTLFDSLMQEYFG